MIDRKTGFTVDPNDHQKYANQIISLLNDPVLSRKMEKTAREQVVKKFSTKVVVKKI